MTRLDQSISHAPEYEWVKITPLHDFNFSFDIEWSGRKGNFPEASVDPVIQIANMVTQQGQLYSSPLLNYRRLFESESRLFIWNMFTLNTCSSTIGSQVIPFTSKAKMLQKLWDFVEWVNPDLIIGYNIANFDILYLIDQAKAYWSRNRHSQSGQGCPLFIKGFQMMRLKRDNVKHNVAAYRVIILRILHHGWTLTRLPLACIYYQGIPICGDGLGSHGWGRSVPPVIYVHTTNRTTSSDNAEHHRCHHSRHRPISIQRVLKSRS